MRAFLSALVLLGAAFAEEESRHISFYGRYARPSYVYYPPTYYYRSFYLPEQCCYQSALSSYNCRLTTSFTGAPICKCCSYNSYMAQTAMQMCSTALAAASATAATTTAAPATTVAPTTAAPVTTTAATTAATTTTTAATTTAQTRVCPNSGCTRRKRAYDFFKALRIEGGTPVSSTCDYPGVVAIEVTGPDGKVLTVCTGVLIDASTAQIPSNCAETMALPAAVNDMVVVDGKKIPVSSVSSDKPLAKVTLQTPVDITAAPTLGCIYDKSMGTYDKSSCEIVGYGVDASNTQQTTAQSAKVTFNSVACGGVDQTLILDEASYGCAVLDNAAACAGDGGALIMCTLDAEPVKVVVGQAETFDCDTSTPAVYFQNFDV